MKNYCFASIWFFFLYTCLKVTLLGLIAAKDKISKHCLTGFQHVFNTEEKDKKNGSGKQIGCHGPFHLPNHIVSFLQSFVKAQTEELL